jgi:predicted O-methyltransferase YrrM
MIQPVERGELLRAISQVRGWLADEEALALYDLARSCTGRGVIVELGSWRGRSTICLALGSRAGAGSEVVAVDRHTDQTFVDFTQNIEQAGVADLVRPIRSLSHDAAYGFDEPIELLFIDASHTYEDAWLDFQLWVPKVVEDGIVAMHDTTWAGSKRVSEECIYHSHRFSNVRFVPSSTTVARKRTSAALVDRLQSERALASKRLAQGGLHVRRFLPRPVVKTLRRLLFSGRAS